MKKTFLALVLGAILILPNITLADGGIFPYYPYWMTESEQKAIIVHENGIETMIVATSFDGNASDFSWIIPTPSQPQVDKASYGLVASVKNFVDSHQYTQYATGAPTGDGSGSSQGVEVITRKNIGFYDVSVLKSSDQDSLYNWLADNGYHYPTAGKYVLDDYIKNGWYFTAMKVNADSIEVAQDQLRYGTADPIRLTFPTSVIVYPLKISGLIVGENGDYSSNNPVPIHLYVFSDSEKQANGFVKEWVGRLEPDVVRGFGFNSDGSPWYNAQKSMVLTYLYDYISPSDMHDDAFITDKIGAAPAPIAYDYEIVSQNAYPTISNNGDTATLRLTLKNTGYEPWSYLGDNPIRLGTSHGNDRISRFYTQVNIDWKGANRVSAISVYPPTYPGEQVEFGFEVSTTSLEEGTYREYFTPLVENKTWMKDMGIYWDITVEPTTYKAEYVDQNSFPTVRKGETSNLWVIYKNVGTATWKASSSFGGYAVRLGTSNLMDRPSAFSDATWISNNRTGTLTKFGEEDPLDVKPGETGFISFQITAPGAPGVYREYFRPLIERYKWLEDAGLYWDITVTD